MRRHVVVIVLLLLAVSVTVFTQQAGSAGAVRQSLLPAELEDRLLALFERNEFNTDPFGPTRWLDGGRRHTSVVRHERGADLVAYDTASGRSETLVASTALTPLDRTSPLALSGYAWSGDRSKLLVYTNTQRVWRQNTRGDYWVLDRAAGTLTKLGANAPASSLMFAKFSPDSRRAAYVRAANLYVEDLTTHDVRPLTSDGGGDVINGTADWVNEEEFGIRDGFRWSPDGQRIAFWQFDTTGVERFTLINNTDSLPRDNGLSVSQTRHHELRGPCRDRACRRWSGHVGAGARRSAPALHSLDRLGGGRHAPSPTHESPAEHERSAGGRCLVGNRAAGLPRRVLDVARRRRHRRGHLGRPRADLDQRTRRLAARLRDRPPVGRGTPAHAVRG